MQQSTPKGAYYLFLGNAAAIFILAITAIVVGRLIGPSNYGLYSLVLVIPTYSFLIMHFGTSTASTRFAAKYVSEGQEARATSFVYSLTCFQIVLSIVTILLVFPFSDLIASKGLNRSELEGYVIPIAMISLAGQTAMNVGFGGFLGLSHFRRAAIVIASQPLVRLIVSVGLVIAGFSFVGAVAGYTAGYVLAGILALIMLISMKRGLALRNFLSDINIALRYSIPVYFASLANGIISPILLTLLALFVTDREIGGYSVVVSVSSIMLIFSYPITSSLLPLFTRTNGMKDLAEAYRTTVRYSGLFVVPVVAFVMLFATPVITLFFGNAYAFAGNYLIPYSLYYLLAGAGSTAYLPFLNGRGKTKDTLLASGIGFLVAIATAIPLIEITGVLGAIVSFVIGNSVALAIGTWMVRNYVHEKLDLLGVWRTYFSSFIAAAISYSARLLPLGTIETTIIGGIVFLLAIIPCMVILGALRSSDVTNIQGYFSDVKSLSPFVILATRYYELFSKWARP